MEWFQNLFTVTDSVAHVVLLYSLVIAVGVWLGKIKFGSVSLGVTFVLFAGIVVGHIYNAAGIADADGGFACPAKVLTFIQDFGLILFVYCIGLQVGPRLLPVFQEGRPALEPHHLGHRRTQHHHHAGALFLGI